tara:strand:+ start:357 stop:1223 length:867 start_codon:yes stop_codon:yes gene_type:complete
MSNFIIEDFKNAWNKKNNGLIKIILINVIIFIGISIIKVFFQIGGLENLYIKFSNSLMLPADLKQFIFQPWSIITYFFLHTNFSHILWNMLFLYWFGKIIQDNIGNNAMISLYVLGGIIGGLLYMAIYNVIPYYGNQVNQSLMLGASAGVFSVVVGSATLIPNYTFHLLFIGPIRIKYIALFYVALSFFDITGNNAGGEIAHLGGAFMGYLYIRQLQSGNNMGDPIMKIINFFNKNNFTKTKTKKNKQNNNEEISQDDIDKILDKISDSGYSSLSKTEKEKLFNASKK